MIFKLLKYIPTPLYPVIVAIIFVISGQLAFDLSETAALPNVSKQNQQSSPQKLRNPAKVKPLTKPNSQIRIRLEQVDNKGNDLGEYYVRGLITSSQPLSEFVDFIWVVPDSMSVIAGHVEGSIDSTDSRGPWEVRLRVHNTEDQWSEPLILTAQTYINGRKVGNAAAFKPNNKTQSNEEGLQKNSVKEPQPLPEKIFF